MLDNLKFRIENKTVINKLLLHTDFEIIASKVNSVVRYKHKTIGKKLRFELKKEFYKGRFIGYKSADVSISPHYHFNDYRHNGNDFAPENCIQSIGSILNYLEIEPHEYNTLKVINIEFALNIIPKTDIKNLINGLYFYKKSKFIIPVKKYPYSKITDTTDYKKIKGYAKGLQFLEFPQYGIHPNTFRFEVKSKQAKNILTYSIHNANDLMNLETYSRLGQTLLDEWENVLLINLKPDLSGLKSNDVQFIKSVKNLDFWEDFKTDTTGKKFKRAKEKYINLLHIKNNLHTEIKGQIIDKLINFQNVPNFTQKTTTNIRKVQTKKTNSTLLNLEYGTNAQNERVSFIY